MHKTQQFILQQLAVSEALRYTDIRPPTMEASKFVYHLKQLQKQGFVIKEVSGAYALTQKGKQHIDLQKDGDEFVHPRVAALVICRHPDKGLLFMHRNVQPARNLFGSPLIDIPMELPDSLSDFVNKRFLAQCGVEASLVHKADGYIKLSKDNKFESSMMTHVFAGEFIEGELKNKSDLMTYYWEEDMPTSAQVFDSTNFIVDFLKGKNRDFFFECSVNITSST